MVGSILAVPLVGGAFWKGERDLMTALATFAEFYRSLGPGSVARLPQVYSDSVVFTDPVTRHTGLAAVARYFDRLLENCVSCRFDITSMSVRADTGYVSWTMRFRHRRLRGGAAITVDGFSVVTLDGGLVSAQRDYYDMGAMIYEHVPLLGRAVSGLRRRMAA